MLGSAGGDGACPGQSASPAPTAINSVAAAAAGQIQRGGLGLSSSLLASSSTGAASPSSPSSLASRPICGPSLPGKASIHCVPEMNSSSAGAGSTLARRTTKIGFCLLTRPLDLAGDEVRAVRRLGQHENERLGALDAPDDLIAVGAPRLHIARRDPALEPALLQGGGNLLRLLGVGLGVADKGRELWRFGLFRRGQMLGVTGYGAPQGIMARAGALTTQLPAPPHTR